MFGEVLTFMLGSGLLVGLIGVLARSLFKHYLDKDLDKFKTELKAEAEKRNFVFQKIYERKLDIISGIYARSVEAGRAAKYAVEMQGNVPEERVPALENDVRNFKEQYEIARLWLDDECCDVIDGLVGEQSMFYKVVNAANMEKSGLGKDWIGGKYVELWERAQNELPNAQEKLRQTFQATMKKIEP